MKKSLMNWSWEVFLFSPECFISGLLAIIAGYFMGLFNLFGV